MPTLALGVFSSGSRAFEVVYLIWWYLGPLEKSPGVDFTAGSPQLYLMAAAGLLPRALPAVKTISNIRICKIDR